MWRLAALLLLGIIAALAALFFVRSGEQQPAIEPESLPATVVAALPSLPDAARPPAEGQLVVGCPLGLLTASGALVPGVDAQLEAQLQGMLDDYALPGGAVVVLEPITGRLLAAAGRRGGRPDREQALRPQYLAGSLVKLITMAALLEQGLLVSEKACFHGGGRGLSLDLLDDDPDLDKTCSTMMEALAKSQNVPFARWADRHLDQRKLRSVLGRFGFKATSELCFGTAEVQESRLGRAQLAAGLGNARMSAWHGALVAATVANQGRWPTSAGLQQVLVPGIAEALGYTLGQTVYAGTGKHVFVQDGQYLLGDMDVAGKTGTRSEGRGESWRETTWFIGFAPVEEPKVAIAAVVENRAHWKLRAHHVALEAFRTALLRMSPIRVGEEKKKGE